MQKAKLDILENIPDLEIAEVKTDAEVELKELNVTPKNWALNKLIFIGAPILIVVIIMIGGLWFLFQEKISPVAKTKIEEKKETELQTNKIEKPEIAAKAGEEGTLKTNQPPPLPAVVPEKVKTAYFNDFIIDLKDTSGKSRVLICDIAFDVVGNQSTNDLEKNADVRRMIYRIAQSKSPVALRSLDERKRLKSEIALELSKMLGEGVVKNVYFTNYLIM